MYMDEKLDEKEKAEFLHHLFQSKRPTISLEDLVEVEKLVKEEIEELVNFPLKYSETYKFFSEYLKEFCFTGL